jgi:hypothetical protein
MAQVRATAAAVGVVGGHVLPAGGRLLDAGAGEERALHLDEMHVGRSPHLLVVARREGAGGPGTALAVGTAFTDDFLPEEMPIDA